MTAPGIGIPNLVEHAACRSCLEPFRGTRNALYCSKYACRLAAHEKDRERMRKSRAKAKKLAERAVAASTSSEPCKYVRSSGEVRGTDSPLLLRRRDNRLTAGEKSQRLSVAGKPNSQPAGE